MVKAKKNDSSAINPTLPKVFINGRFSAARRTQTPIDGIVVSREAYARTARRVSRSGSLTEMSNLWVDDSRG